MLAKAHAVMMAGQPDGWTPGFSHVVANAGWADRTAEGGTGRWEMPLCTWHAPTGFYAPQAYPLDHHTLAFLFAGGTVAARRGRVRQTVAQAMAHRVTLQPQGVATDYEARGDIRFGHLYLRDTFARGIAVELFGGRGDREPLLRDDRLSVDDRELRAMGNAYFAAALADPPPPALEMDARATLVAVRLLRLDAVHTPPRARAGALAPWQVRRATEYLAAHLAHDVRLAELAATVGLSPFHFARAFKASTGLPPAAYQRRLRIERACALLSDFRTSVTDVALAVGYETPQAFARAFRAATGASPGAWRRERWA